jgi:PPK2 family polyphosphate:nucleotide phosphotransferase
MADQRVKNIGEFVELFRVRPGSRVNVVKDFDPGYTADLLTKEESDELLQRSVGLLADYQARLAAQDTYSVLMCLQALDAAGKDGTISHVMSGVNPQGVEVHGFGVPSAEELDHDYLWRYQQKLPARGDIGIFNRSHYEEVLVVRVHPELLERQKLPKSARGRDVWKRRYREINEWERHLVDNGYKVVKIFLNISKEEQRKRFLARIDLAEKNWKFSSSDAKEREYWDDYQKAFSEMLSNTSTEWAPWYVIPADHKWFARNAAAAVLADTLMTINPQYPVIAAEELAALDATKTALEAEAPPGAKLDPVEAELQPEAARESGAKGRAKQSAKKRSKKKSKKH